MLCMSLEEASKPPPAESLERNDKLQGSGDPMLSQHRSERAGVFKMPCVFQLPLVKIDVGSSWTVIILSLLSG